MFPAVGIKTLTFCYLCPRISSGALKRAQLDGGLFKPSTSAGDVATGI